MLCIERRRETSIQSSQEVKLLPQIRHILEVCILSLALESMFDEVLGGRLIE